MQPGDIVVAACTADNTDGFFGDLLATSFRARGAVGLVIDGGYVFDYQPQSTQKSWAQDTFNFPSGGKSEAKSEARSAAKSRSEQEFEDQQAANQEADAMLTKKLTICRDCMPSARDRDAAAAGSVMR